MVFHSAIRRVGGRVGKSGGVPFGIPSGMRSAIPSGMRGAIEAEEEIQALQFQLQMQHLLVLLDEHRQQHDLEGQQVRGIGGGGQMMARGGEQVVEGALVGAPQGAAEAGERLLLVQEGVGDGGESAAHK